MSYCVYPQTECLKRDIKNMSVVARDRILRNCDFIYPRNIRLEPYGGVIIDGDGESVRVLPFPTAFGDYHFNVSCGTEVFLSTLTDVPRVVGFFREESGL